jgi:phosphotransferase family enzyme
MASMHDEVTILEREAFIRKTVWPLVGGGSEPPGFDFERHRHGIVEYRFDGGPRIFAKPLLDRDDGLAAHRILLGFWEQGFGADAEYRVAEPIAYLDDSRVVIVGAAPGECLLELLARGRLAWEEGVRRAARWLATLHSSPLRLGAVDDSTRRALHLARRVAQTIARRPDLEALLVRLLGELSARAPATSSRLEVQTHGRFHAEHVYLTPEHVTVIDLDRASRGDRAKDVGEFLHRLRTGATRRALDPESAEQARRVFLEEYVRRTDGDLSALLFFWSYSVLFELVSRAGRTADDRAQAPEDTAFYASEFAAIPERMASFDFLR